MLNLDEDYKYRIEDYQNSFKFSESYTQSQLIVQYADKEDTVDSFLDQLALEKL